MMPALAKAMRTHKSKKPLPLRLPSEHVVNRSGRPPQMEKGFPVLHLPLTGDKLMEGRQYYLSPVARAAVKHMYGFDAPRVVECVHKESHAFRYRTLKEDLTTGEIIGWSIVDNPPREATFRAFNSKTRIFKFTLDLVKLHEEELKHMDSHLAREIEEDEKERKMRVPGAYRKAKDTAEAKKIMEINIADLMKL